MNKIAAIIPFKEKSLGLKGKNFKKISNLHLYEITLLQALNSKKINKVYISTDTKKILKKYKNNPKISIIERPKKYCRKESSTEDAILHLLNNSDLQKYYNTLVLLQVTSPLRKKLDIDSAIKYFNKKKLDSLFSANLLEDFLFWVEQNKKLKSLNYDYRKRDIRQNRKKQFLENGSLYVFNIEKFLKEKNRLFGNIGFYCMDLWQQFEIDNFEDYKFCKEVFKLYRKKIL